MAKIKISAPYVLILILFIVIIFQSQYPKSDLENRLNELHKQNNFKIKYNEEHNRINTLSNRNTVNEFTNAFE